MKTSMKVFVTKYMKKPLVSSYWWIHGPAFKNPTLPVDPRSFLFICKGNICRSVFAQARAKEMAVEKGIPYTVFDSAGLEVSGAFPPPQEAILAAREFGIALDIHRSKRISREMLESFDMVIAMEPWQLQVLARFYPPGRDRLFLLPLFDKGGRNTGDRFSTYNIADPFAEDVARFRACYGRIDKCLAGLFRQLGPGADN